LTTNPANRKPIPNNGTRPTSRVRKAGMMLRKPEGKTIATVAPTTIRKMTVVITMSVRLMPIRRVKRLTGARKFCSNVPFICSSRKATPTSSTTTQLVIQTALPRIS
jgi:hypothetical protein